MVETYQNYVGNQWKSSRSGATFENENPANRGSVLGCFQSSTAEDVLRGHRGCGRCVHALAAHPAYRAPASHQRISAPVEGDA